LETFKSFGSKIYTVNDTSFTDIALDVFHFQAANNELYRDYIDRLKVSVSDIKSLNEIPFLPISFFKTHKVITGGWIPEAKFTSSGTTNTTTSSHYLRDLQFYLKNAQACFEHFFGSLTDYHFLALLPSYLERKDSSLVAMMDHFIRSSNSPHSAFYLHDYRGLTSKLHALKNDSRKTILWGVTFALLDLAEQYPQDLSHCMIFETGGMKGKRREMTRNELQDTVNARLNVKSLFSEYGMTELLSQGYSKGVNLGFLCPPWMRVLCRDITDPLEKGLLSQSGGINVIDLANWNTISFIETEDLGKAYTDGSFEVLGRLDNSDLRGCNLMID
jgi:phenylacetate-coenzyme A ligase PaaK-like adenylate-forming protein